MAATDMDKTRQLLEQAEKILLHPIHPHLIAYCPTMDLIAVVTDEENLDVYRINGQRAFGLKRKSEDVTVDALQWEFNGKSIAVSWSDGSTDLVSAETGKVTHKDVMLPSTAVEGNLVDDETPARVKCMGWGLNFIDVDAVKRRTGLKPPKTNGAESTQVDGFGNPTTEDWDAFKDGTTLEDFLQRQPDLQTLDIAPDLPDQLAMMDMEAVLPRLPAIPLPPALPFMRVQQATSGGFSSQAEVDSLLHSHHLKDHNSVDMFIRCSDRGTVHPSIYDSLETVNIQLPSAWDVDSTSLLHTSHPYSCTHSLLMSITSASAPRRQQIAFVPLTLNFIPSAGIYLHLIASKTSQLQNLLLYITQTLQRVRTFFKQSTDLPSKFMLNISETLSEKGQGELTTNLFHIACTGNSSPTMREWLVDELAEAGHKRWDNAVTTNLNTLLALVHENLIPALDRCSIVISRLRGLAKFHDTEWIFSGPISEFSALLETLKNMRLLAHTLLLYGSEEKRQFHQFSKWLRFTIDFEATEPESQSRSEMENRDPGVDIAMVLEYIRYGLTKSDLTPFLQQGESDKETRSYEDTKKAIEVLKEGGKYKEDALCLESVCSGLKDGVQGLLKQVSKWQENNILMNGGVVLDNIARDEELGVDMRMVFEPSSNTLSTYTALVLPSTPSRLAIHRITHTPSITTLQKDIHAYALCTLDFSTTLTTTTTPPQPTILDAKFADDSALLVLVTYPSPPAADHPRRSLLLSLPYTLPPSPTTPMSYHAITPAYLPSALPPRSASLPVSAMTRDAVAQHTVHVFEGRFVPLKMVVNGRKGRRVVVVLGSDCKHYRVLDLDFKEGEGEDEGEGEGEGDQDDGEDAEMIGL
ncbi:hypothetical protein ACN47E_004042 [Coniothyrium glycines]